MVSEASTSFEDTMTDTTMKFGKYGFAKISRQIVHSLRIAKVAEMGRSTMQIITPPRIYDEPTLIESHKHMTVEKVEVQMKNHQLRLAEVNNRCAR